MIKEKNPTDLKQALRDHMKEKGISQVEVGRAISRSGSSLSAWLTGTYPGNIEDLEFRVRNYLTRAAARESSLPRLTPFVSTSISRKIFEVAELSHLECELGVVTGEAGIGKTESLLEYAARNPEVILIQADLSFSAKVLFKKLLEALDITKNGTIQEMLDLVVAKLKGSGRLIMVDEAEHLPYRALELLRRVLDKAGVGILLVGMRRLYYNLRDDKNHFSQLYSRVGVYVQLPSKITKDDTRVLVQSMLQDERADWTPFEEVSGGNARKLSKLVRRSQRIAQINNSPLDAEVVKASASMLMF